MLDLLLLILYLSSILFSNKNQHSLNGWSVREGVSSPQWLLAELSRFQSMAELLYSSERKSDRGNGDDPFIFTRLNLAAGENITKSDLNNRVQLIISLIKWCPRILAFWLLHSAAHPHWVSYCSSWHFCWLSLHGSWLMVGGGLF